MTNIKKMLMTSAAMLAAACGTDTLVSTATTAAALEAAQCDFGSFDAAAAQCRATFEACIAAAGADLTACKDALRLCLPPPPDHGQGGMGADGCPGGGMGGHPGGPGGPPPGDFDGGFPPPPPEGAGGPPPFDADGGLPPPPPGDLDGGRGPGGHHGGHGRGPHPDPAVIQACRDALTACLAADPSDATCAETEHACVKAAFDAAFQAACTDAQARCANDTSEPCQRILARCADGVGGSNGTCGGAADAG